MSIIKSNHDGGSSSDIDLPVEVVAREVADVEKFIPAWVIAVDEVGSILVSAIATNNVEFCILAQSKTGGSRDGKGAGLDGKSEGGEGCDGEHFWLDLEVIKGAFRRNERQG